MHYLGQEGLLRVLGEDPEFPCTQRDTTAV